MSDQMLLDVHRVPGVNAIQGCVLRWKSLQLQYKAVDTNPFA
jgi:hypothetical protein